MYSLRYTKVIQKQGRKEFPFQSENSMIQLNPLKWGNSQKQANIFSTYLGFPACLKKIIVEKSVSSCFSKTFPSKRNSHLSDVLTVIQYSNFEKQVIHL